MTSFNGLSLVVFSGDFDRVHYALAMAAAAAAAGRRVSLLFAGRALKALQAETPAMLPGWHGLDSTGDGSAPAARDHAFGQSGIATFEELLGACAALEVPVIACEMGLRALGLATTTPLRSDLSITVGGIVSFLTGAAESQILFI